MSIMKENEFSSFGKTVVVIGVGCIVLAALVHIIQAEPQHPFAFVITLGGFVLLLVAKLSVITQRQWISFGSGLMTPGMRDTYRVGYWLMAVGILTTFVG